MDTIIPLSDFVLICLAKMMEDKPMYNSRTPGLSNTQQKYLRELNLVSQRNCQLRARVSPEEALVNAELEDLSNLLASLESFSGK
ncbi:MAG: hypothetical protein ACRCT1_13245 [Microcoleaceae cyanobacterium]|jgi:hypothetical protein